jgi:methionine-rich copper-binding protein CopC
MPKCQPGRTTGRKRTAALLVGSVALATPALLGGTAAQASLTGPGVGDGRNITVFHDLDMVAVYGYEPAGTPLRVEVVRNGQVVGRASGASKALADGTGLEINHGLEAVAAQPGDCWDQQTPDIRPGDRVVVTADGDTDEVTVDDIRWSKAPYLAANGDVVVEGHARYADGTPIPLSVLQADEFRNDSGEYRITPDAPTALGSDGSFQVRYRAPFTGDRNRENLTLAQRQEVLLGNGHTVGFGHAEALPLPAETQLVSGPAETNGPAAGCEGAPAGGAPLPGLETTPPTVTPLDPAAGAIAVARTSNITAQFDEPVSGVDAASFWLTDSMGLGYMSTVSYDPATRVATLNPAGTTLPADRLMKVTMTGGVTDLSGNALAPTSWTFTTAPLAPTVDTTPPTVTGRGPVAGATDVGPGTDVTATFSEVVAGVDATSFRLVDGNGAAVPAAVSFLNRTATLDPSAPLQPSTTYTASLSAAVRDGALNALTPTEWSFTTAAAVAGGPTDTTTPSITAHTPASGATGISVDDTVTATFSEPVWVTSDSFTLSSTAGQVSAAVDYDVDSRTATLYPLNSLAAGTTYTAELTAEVLDDADNPLVPTTWSFTTAGAAVVQPPADTTAPTVTGHGPANGSTDTPVGSTVTATFSEDVTGADGTNVTLTGPAGKVAATVGYDAATRTATLDPSADLVAGTGYTATVGTGVKDAAGNALAAARSWTFTTARPADTVRPTVTTWTPAANATGVDVNGDLTVTFSEPVTGVTASSFTVRAGSGAAVPAAVGYDAATRRATLNPNASLAAGTRYTVGLTNAVRDTAGNPLTATTSTFTTVAADTTRPTVTSRTPAANATGVDVNADLTATFSEPVTGVSATAFTVRAGNGATVPAAVSYDAATRVATLNPNAGLAAGTRYTVGLTTAVRDAAGNTLAATTWTMTTAAPVVADTVRPTITSRTPAVNAKNVRLNGDVTVTFSEAVTGVSGTTVTLRTANGTAVPATVSYNTTTRVATLNPIADLAARTTYTVGLTTGVQDAAGNTFAATSWSFTTVK